MAASAAYPVMVKTRRSVLELSTEMASLNKLAIRGIRSFDDKQIAVIEFYSPVTVIVGHNGSGKTVSTRVHFNIKLLFL